MKHTSTRERSVFPRKEQAIAPLNEPLIQSIDSSGGDQPRNSTLYHLARFYGTQSALQRYLSLQVRRS